MKMETLKQKLIKIVDKIVSPKKDKFIIIDIDSKKVYTTKAIESTNQLIELRKPLSVKINTDEDVKVLTSLLSSEFIKAKYSYSDINSLSIGKYFILDPLTLVINIETIVSEGDIEFDWVDLNYLTYLLSDCFILDMSSTNRETVDWLLGFLTFNNYTISKSDGQYGSQLLIDRSRKLIRPCNILSERDRLLLEVKDFKQLFNEIIA